MLILSGQARFNIFPEPAIAPAKMQISRTLICYEIWYRIIGDPSAEAQCRTPPRMAQRTRRSCIAPTVPNARPRGMTAVDAHSGRHTTPHVDWGFGFWNNAALTSRTSPKHIQRFYPLMSSNVLSFRSTAADSRRNARDEPRRPRDGQNLASACSLPTLAPEIRPTRIITTHGQSSYLNT